MNHIPKLCAWAGLALFVVSLVTRLPDGFQFSTRGLMEFTQTLLLLGICMGISQKNDKS